jgi:opacity protein-like surface antigen
VKLIVYRLIPILTFLVAGCLLASAQASPSHEESTYEFTGFGGVSGAGDHDFPTLVWRDDAVTSQTEGMHFASGYQVGLRVSENLSDHWAVHLEYSFANQPLRFTNLSPTVESLSLGHYVHHLSYDASFLLLPPNKRFRPYLKAGAGTALFYIAGHSKDEARAAGVPLRDSWEFAFNWGAGLKTHVQDQVLLIFEVKDQVSGIPSYGLPHSAVIRDGQFVPGISRNGFLHNVQLNVGIGFQWDD